MPVIDAIQTAIDSVAAAVSSTTSSRGGLLDAMLPPASRAPPDSAVVERVALYLRKSNDGLDFNAHLRSLKSFRNPSILEKLVSKFNIDEHGSLCDPAVWNPHQFDGAERYDALAKRAKQTEFERSSAATGRVEFVPASSAPTSAKPPPPLSEHAKKLAKKEKFRQKAIQQRETAAQAAAAARESHAAKKRTWF
jgi:hypothetical protein